MRLVIQIFGIALAAYIVALPWITHHRAPESREERTQILARGFKPVPPLILVLASLVLVSKLT